MWAALLACLLFSKELHYKNNPSTQCLKNYSRKKQLCSKVEQPLPQLNVFKMINS
jgi:hypothetical protein